MNLDDRACLSVPASIPSQQKKDSIEIDIPYGSNGCTPQIKELDFCLRPVPPFASGEGLPYAPIHWPNPGDNWRWKVGKRVSKYGFYLDRYLYLPSRLQRPRCTNQGFACKVAVKRYLQTEFPGADIDAFFASFSWKVPAEAAAVPCPLNACLQVETEKAKDVVEKIPYTFLRKRKRATVPPIFKRQTRHSKQPVFPFTPKHTAVTIDLTGEAGTSDSTSKDRRSTTDIECDQVPTCHVSISPASSSVATCPSPVTYKSIMDTRPESPAEVIREDFDNFIDSLDDILAQPLSQAPVSPPATDSSRNLENEMAEARMKLSSLLAVDFPLLVSRWNLAELSILSSKLQKDPNLTADQLLKLKLIEEIPLISKDFLKTKQTIEQADKFFADHKANIKEATNCRRQYTVCKEKTVEFQDEIDSMSSAIQEIDDQIAKLQSQRTKLNEAVSHKAMLKRTLDSAQRSVVDTLPSIVLKVQQANSKKTEWELKKINSAKREAEILARYAPLKGFSL